MFFNLLAAFVWSHKLFIFYSPVYVINVLLLFAEFQSRQLSAADLTIKIMPVTPIVHPIALIRPPSFNVVRGNELNNYAEKSGLSGKAMV